MLSVCLVFGMGIVNVEVYNCGFYEGFGLS